MPLINDSHDAEKFKKIPLFCEFLFKGSIQRVCFRHPQGLTKKPSFIVQVISCEHGRRKRIDVALGLFLCEDCDWAGVGGFKK